MAGRIRAVDTRGQEQRKRERHRAGTLQELLVGAATLKRYRHETLAFFTWLEQEGHEVPTGVEDLDELMAAYLEYLWEVGDARARAANAICGLQHYMPRVKRHLPQAWRYYKTWASREIPARS